MKTLVVPVDGSAVSERAIPVASSLARRTGAEVVVLLVSASGGADAVAEVSYVERVVDRFPTSTVCRAVVDERAASVARVIVDEAASAADAVVVMATHGRSPAEQVVLGSVASSVLRTIDEPVILIGPHCRGATDLRGHFVVAVDGSDRDEVLIDAAAKWAASTSTRPVALHVSSSGSDADSTAGAGDDIASNAADALRRRGCLATDTTVAASHAASGVVSYSTEHLASAVLVGHHRRRRVGRFILGSQALEIVRDARCPVVVIPD